MNILIIGPSRSGKTSLAELISKELNYNIISLDTIIGSLEKYNIGIKHDGNDLEVTNKFKLFLKNYLNELSNNATYYRKNYFVVEGTHIDFSLLPLDKYIVIGLINNATSLELYNNMKKYDTEDDWTYYLNDDELKSDASYFVKRNEYLKNKFKEYNIKTFDVTNNRQEVFKEIIKYIKEY